MSNAALSQVEKVWEDAALLMKALLPAEIPKILSNGPNWAALGGLIPTVFRISEKVKKFNLL